MCIYDGPYVSLSLQRFFYFPSAILYFPSAIFYFPSPFFKFPFRVSFLLPFTIFCASLPSLFTSLQSIQHSFYLPSVFFTTLQVLLFFYFPLAFFLLPFNFFKLFLLSFGIFIVSFLIFKYRRKLNCNDSLLHKNFLKRISKASLGHVKTILKLSLKINDWIIAECFFRYLVCRLN